MTTKCESITIRREDDDELGLFIYAVATLTFERDGTTLVQELKSGGLGDVQGDEAYLVLVGEEQRAELVEMLDTLGLSDPASVATEHVPARKLQRGDLLRVMREDDSESYREVFDAQPVEGGERTRVVVGWRGEEPPHFHSMTVYMTPDLVVERRAPRRAP